MICAGCSFTYTPDSGQENCRSCGMPIVNEVDDFFSYRVGDLFREVRPAQLKMAVAIESMYRQDSGTFVCEAPVGTGKTFAYLLPTLLKISYEKMRLEGVKKGDSYDGFGAEPSAFIPQLKTVQHVTKAGKKYLKKTADMEEQIPFRVVITTAKKSLQDQLINQDLPFLQKKTGLPFTFAIRKGANAYACKMKISASEKMIEKVTTTARAIRKEEQPIWDARDGIAKIAEWVEESEMGDFGEFETEIDESIKGRLDATNCLGADCPKAESCGFRLMKQRCSRADIIVSNHHVFALDYQLSQRILRPRHAVIIDEAHQLEESMRSALTVTLSSGAVTRVLNSLQNVMPLGSRRPYELSNAWRLNETWDLCFEKIKGQVGMVNPNPFGTAAADAVAEVKKAEKEILEWFRAMGCTVTDMTEADDDGEVVSTGVFVSVADEDHLEIYLALWRIYNTVHGMCTSLEAIADEKKALEQVAYVESDQFATKLMLAPISVGAACYNMWANTQYVTVTSGTITTDGDFRAIKDALGLYHIKQRKPDASQVANAWQPGGVAGALLPPVPIPDDHFPRMPELLTLPSPFDFKNRALLYTPREIPLPPSGPDASDETRKIYTTAIAKETTLLAREAKGNAFVLFTSLKELQETQLILEEMNRSPNCKFPLEFIPQGSSPALALRKFMNTPNGVLLGLKSFWEGVDVQGDKLRLVVIPKLPFTPPYDPVMMAKERQLRARYEEKKEPIDPGEIFNTLQVPAMIIQMRQAAGRLIRSQTDRGVCAILDCRVWTGRSSRAPYASQAAYYGYGKVLINALGFPSRTAMRVQAQGFLRYIAQNPHA